MPDPGLYPFRAAPTHAEDRLRAFYARELVQIAYYKEAHFRLGPLALERIQVLVNKVIRARLERAQRLLQLYLAAGLRPFEPILVRQAGGTFSLVSPPTAEMRGDDAVVMDGSHRVMAAWQLGLREIVVAQIRARALPPPASDSFDCRDVQVVENVGHWTDRTVGFQPELFRPVPMILDRLSRRPVGAED
jgi:hypothetical protein